MADKLVVKVGANTEEFKNSLSKLGGVAKGAFAGMATATAAVTAAAVGAAKAMTDLAGGAAKYADDINTMSTVMGVSADTLQKWTYAADLVDVSTDTIATAMRKVTTSADSAASGTKSAQEKFARLGISVKDTNGNLKDSETLFMESIDALGNIQNATERDAIAMELFGKSAQDLNPLIAAGSAKLAELGDEAAATGYVMSESALAAANEYQDALDRMSLAATGMKNTIGVAAVGVLGPFVTEVTAGMQEITQVLQGGGGIADAIDIAFETIGNLAPRVLSIIDSVMGALSNALPAMLPKLLSGVTALMSSVSKKLPDLFKGVIAMLPSVFGQLGDTIPQLIDVATDGLGQVMETIITTIPEWGPALTSALVKTATSAVNGIGTVLTGAINAALSTFGIDAFKKADLTQAMSEWVEKATGDTTKDVTLGTVSPTINVNDPTFTFANDFKTLSEELITAYTNGIAGDDAQAQANYESAVTAKVTEVAGQIEQWRVTAIEELKTQLASGEIGQTEFDTKVQEVNALADSSLVAVQNAGDAAIQWGQTYSGAATSVVGEHVSELDGYLTEIEGVEERLNQLDQRLSGSAENLVNQRRILVATGSTTDMNTIANAFESTDQMLERALNQNATDRQFELDQAALNYGDDIEGYSEAEREILERYAEKEQGILDQFGGDMRLLWAGVISTFGAGDFSLETYNFAKDIDTVFGGMEKAVADGSKGFDGVKTSVLDYMTESGFTESDIQFMAQQLGVEDVGKGLPDAIAEYIAKGYGNYERHGGQGDQIFQQIREGAVVDVESMLSTLPQELQDLAAMGLDSGWFDEIGLAKNGVLDVDAFLQMVMGDYDPNDIPNTIFEEVSQAKQDTVDAVSDAMSEPTETPETSEPVEVTSPEIDIVPGKTTTEGISESIGDTIEEATSTDVPEASVTADISVETGEDTGVSDAVTESLGEKAMTIDVKASVSLDVTVSDSNGRAVGEAAGLEIAAGVASGVSSNFSIISSALSTTVGKMNAEDVKSSGYNAAYDVGGYSATGFKLGLLAKQTELINAAKELAKSVASAIRLELQIHSPSRVMQEIGQYTGEGFEIGISDSMKSAVRSAQNIVGAMNLQPNTAFESFGESINGLTDAMSGDYGNLYLNVNGKQLASVTAGDNNQAINGYARRIALGLGRG